jgi:peptidyl-prolyl cis-trans isomerase D
MFDSVRTHRRWLMLFLVVLIFPSFVFFGIQGYNSFFEQEGAIARVDGAPVTQQEFDQAQRDRIERLRQTFGQDFDPRLLDTQEARASILDGVLLNRALTSEANKSGIVVTTDRLREVIASIPAFQDDGKFNYDRYKAYVASQGMSEPMFEQRVREDLRKQVLVQGVAGSAMVPRDVAERLDRMLREQRQIRELRFPAEQFQAQVSVTDAQVAEFYEKNRALFETPESARVEYLVLSPDTMTVTAPVSEADARAYYEQNKARFGTEEQRRASHILITADGSDKAAARRKADELLAQVRAKPSEFEKLAREHSRDPGSAAQGGDLGFFGRGMMVKPFEDAVQKLKPGEISDVVETDFGFHIVRLTEVKPADAKPFEQARADIERDLKSQRAQGEFAKAADQFTNLVYEQADSLQPAADALKLKIQQVDALTRRGAPPFINARVVDALFSDESLKNRATPRRSKSPPTRWWLRASSTTSRPPCARLTKSGRRCASWSNGARRSAWRARQAKPGLPNCASSRQMPVSSLRAPCHAATRRDFLQMC